MKNDTLHLMYRDWEHYQRTHDPKVQQAFEELRHTPIVGLETPDQKSHRAWIEELDSKVLHPEGQEEMVA